MKLGERLAVPENHTHTCMLTPEKSLKSMKDTKHTVF